MLALSSLSPCQLGMRSLILLLCCRFSLCLSARGELSLAQLRTGSWGGVRRDPDSSGRGRALAAVQPAAGLQPEALSPLPTGP